jgi:hypothetical protein
MTDLAAQSVRVRVVIDTLFVTFMLGLAFYAGIETQRLNAIDGQIAKIDALNIDHRLTTLDDRQLATLEELHQITVQLGQLNIRLDAREVQQ